MDFPRPVLLYPDDPALSFKIAHPGEDVGFDLRAAEYAEVYPGESRIIDTKVKVFMPPLEDPYMFELQIRSRSGLASKGIIVANQPGTIEPGYKDTIKTIIYNTGTHWDRDPFVISYGDRIAQAVLAIVFNPSFITVTHHEEGFKILHSTYYNSRGEGGFGSSGIN